MRYLTGKFFSEIGFRKSVFGRLEIAALVITMLSASCRTPSETNTSKIFLEDASKANDEILIGKTSSKELVEKYGEPHDKTSREDGYEVWTYFDDKKNLSLGFTDLVIRKSDNIVCAKWFHQQTKLERDANGGLTRQIINSPLTGTEECIPIMQEENENIRRRNARNPK